MLRDQTIPNIRYGHLFIFSRVALALGVHNRRSASVSGHVNPHVMVTVYAHTTPVHDDLAAAWGRPWRHLDCYRYRTVEVGLGHFAIVNLKIEPPPRFGSTQILPP
jgi:hypothetical protein